MDPPGGLRTRLWSEEVMSRKKSDLGVGEKEKKRDQEKTKTLRARKDDSGPNRQGEHLTGLKKDA